MSWPSGGLAERHIVHTPFQLVDVVPTLLEAAVSAQSTRPKTTSATAGIRWPTSSTLPTT